MEKFRHAVIGGRNFRSEFKHQVRLIIIITLAFTIAFSWRETVFDLFTGLAKWLTDINNEESLSILASTLITITSIIIIYVTAHVLKDKPDSYS